MVESYVEPEQSEEPCTEAEGYDNDVRNGGECDDDRNDNDELRSDDEECVTDAEHSEKRMEEGTDEQDVCFLLLIVRHH